MQATKINSFTTVVNFSMIIISLMSFCQQVSKSNKRKLENSSKEKSIVATPTMDIQMVIMSDNL
jgi:hypothetical protein